MRGEETQRSKEIESELESEKRKRKEEELKVVRCEIFVVSFRFLRLNFFFHILKLFVTFLFTNGISMKV